MANFSINNNPPGVKLSIRDEPAIAVQSSQIIPMLIVACDPDAMADELDGYVLANANTDVSLAKYDSPGAVKANQYVGFYIYAAALDEARLITKNSSAAIAGEVTVYVDKPFTSAPTTGESFNIRPWEKLYVPKMYSSAQKFYADYLEENSDGTYNFTSLQKNVRYILKSAFDNGVSRALILPVESDAEESALVGNLGDTDNADLINAFRLLSIKPDTIHLNHCDAFPVDISAANWSTIVSAWDTFVSNYATNATVDVSLPQMAVVAGTPTRDEEVAQTFANSTLNSTSERLFLYHGKYMVTGIDDGTRQMVCPAAALAGVFNRVSTQSAVSTGHAFSGTRLTQIVDSLGVVEDLSDASVLELTEDGVNALVTRPGFGTYVVQQLTQAKGSTSSATTTSENIHSVISRNRIFNALQPVLARSIDEPNTSTTRSIILSQINSFLDAQVSAGIVSSYSALDATSDSDRAAKTAVFELSVKFPNEIKFISINLTGQLS